MLIVAGTREARKKLGRVGDYCFVCRNVTAFRATRVSKVSHLYYIPLGAGKKVGTELVCESCRTVYLSGAEFADAAKDAALDPIALAERTNPALFDDLESRMAIEAKAAEGALDPEERRALIVEGLLALDHHGARAAGSSGASGTWVGAVAFLGALVLVSVTIAVWHDPSVGWVAKGAIVAGAAGLLALGTHNILTVRRRIARRELYPRLVRSLALVRPTRAEIAVALADLKQGKSAMARRVRADDLAEALAAAGVLGSS